MIYTDQLMREVRLEKPPSRIISLVPSITELLSDLGLDASIAGITKFCIHPEHLFRSKTRVGGTKKVDPEKIKSLEPDLIIANKEENTKSDIDLLSQHYPVWISDIQNLEDACAMISAIGKFTGTIQRAEEINSEIKTGFKKIKPLPLKNTLYMIWRKPFMAAGSNTFISDMLNRCGLQNVLPSGSRYPELSTSQIIDLNPEIVLLSSEPYPFSEKHISEILSLLPGSRVLVVDGTYFSWYGSRLVHSPGYFSKLINDLNAQNQQATLYEN